MTARDIARGTHRAAGRAAAPAIPVALAVTLAIAAAPDAGPASWAPTIQCPSGREYRDLHALEAHDEFCALALPGALVVRDGPARSWYGREHLRAEGRYESGRKVGRWRECDASDRCRDHDYPVVESYERSHDVKPALPVAYSGGKYAFDFASCWSTSLARQADGTTLDMTIAGGMVRCQVGYDASVDGAPPAEGQGHVECAVPYIVGRREFDSLDLRRELPKAGLPQFCRLATHASDQSGDPPEQAFAIWMSQPIEGAGAQPEGSAWVLLANMLDVDCASIQRQPSGADRLTVRLNEFAERLVLGQVGKTALKTDSCNRWLPLPPMRITHEASGRSLFGYDLGPGRTAADQERKCIESAIDLQAGCSSPGSGATTASHPAAGTKP